MTKPQLGKFGVFGHYSQWQQLSPQQLKDIEALGYGAIWAGGSPPAELEWIDPILEVTDNLALATGIVNIWTAAAGPVADSFHRIEKAYPGRFLLGIGVGHPEAHTEYKKPYDALNDYLDELDEYGVPKDRRVVAALGPSVLLTCATTSKSPSKRPSQARPRSCGCRRQYPVRLAPAPVPRSVPGRRTVRSVGVRAIAESW